MYFALKFKITISWSMSYCNVMSNEVAAVASPTYKNNKIKFNIIVSLFMAKVFYLAIIFIIVYGWLQKSNSNLSPESGVGYYLGIIGGSLMLLLLIYPLRKKSRFLRSFGLVKHWFKMHMLFGVLGPVAILYHANFGLGSVNSNIAMFSMIAVAISGLVGRYLYTKIHHGLYGQKASIKELRDSLMISKGNLDKYFTLSKEALLVIKNIEEQTLKERNIFVAMFLWLIIKSKAGWAKYRLKRLFAKEYLNQASVSAGDHESIKTIRNKESAKVIAYINALYKIFGSKIFESLFSLWHVLHLPLFIMLIVSGVLHVFVVHSY